MKWGDNARDFDTALAVWPHYRPLFDNWLMQELVEGDKAPVWRLSGSRDRTICRRHAQSDAARRARSARNGFREETFAPA